MKKWQTATMISLLCFSMLLIATPLATPQVKAASALSIVGSIEWKVVYTDYYYDTAWTVGDAAYLVTATVTSGGSPVSGVSVVADVIGPNDEAYWLRDGTQMLYDTIQGKGMDESGWKSGPTYGGGLNDGIYANFLELDPRPSEGSFGFFADHAGTWTIRLTASKGGYDSASTELTLNVEEKTGNFGHNFRFIDLDASTPEEDWVVYASPGQTVNAKLVYDETNPCAACCVFYIRAWGSPYEEWGNSYNIDSGCTGYRLNVEKTWTYTAPSTPGVYTLTLSDIFAYWWPYYGESVGFVGKVVVGSIPDLVVVTPPYWDFNVLVVGGTAEKQLIITNIQEKDITITDIITPDYIELDHGCWFDWWIIHLRCSALPPIDLSPGESKTLTFNLDSDSLAGIIDDTIVMKVRLKEVGEVEIVAIPVRGTVVSDPEVLRYYSAAAGNLSNVFRPDYALPGIKSALQAINDACEAMKDRVDGNYWDCLQHLKSYGENMKNAFDYEHWQETLIDAEMRLCLSLDRYIGGFRSISASLSNAATALENAQSASDPSDVDTYLQQASDSFEAAMKTSAELNERFNIKNEDLTGVEHNDRGTLNNTAPKDVWPEATDFVDNLGDTIAGFSLALAQGKSLVIVADSPVDLIVEGPLGEVISKTINEILGSEYLETDVDGDGEKEDLVIIYSRQPGVYLVTPIPQEGAMPEETYSLGWISGDEKRVLAEGQPLGDIPTDGFPIFSNRAPLADAGPDQTVYVAPPAATAMVMLDGSSSHDPDGDSLTYNWTWGSNISYGVNPTVELPLGTSTVTLTVDDGALSDSDAVDITVEQAVIPPVGGEAHPISKIGVMAPWISALAALMAGLSVLVLRRRRVQS